MRTIDEINKEALDTLPIDHLIHGEIMNGIVDIQEQIEDPSSKFRLSYLNGKLDALLGVYGLLNDIIWHKEQLEKSANA